MKRTIKYTLCILLVISVICISCSCLYAPDNTPKGDWSDDFDFLGKVVEYVKANYIGDVDLDKMDYMTAYALITALDDFSYLTDDTVTTISNATLGVAITRTKYNEHIISHIYDGFPASEIKSDGFCLKRGDFIYAVNGERVEGASSAVFNSLVSGGVGTEIVLTIKRDGVILGDYSYTKVDKYVPRAVYISDISEEVGYIRLSDFSETKLSSGIIVSVNDEFDSCMASLVDDGKTSLILDLRGNPGGSASILSHIASYFVPLDNGKPRDILSLSYAKGNAEVMVKVSEDNYVDMPVTVLVDENTASAAEALTGALRAYNSDNTTVIGNKTYGKGVFQSRSPKIEDITSTSDAFNDSYYIMLVSGYYYIIDPSYEDGRYCIHQNGIVPDIQVTKSDIHALIDDAEIVKALEILSK